MAGVAPPLETTGAVPVTDVTVPTDTEPPRLTADPLIVMLELARLVLGMVVTFSHAVLPAFLRIKLPAATLLNPTSPSYCPSSPPNVGLMNNEPLDAAYTTAHT